MRDLSHTPTHAPHTITPTPAPLPLVRITADITTPRRGGTYAIPRGLCKAGEWRWV